MKEVLLALAMATATTAHADTGTAEAVETTKEAKVWQSYAEKHKLPYDASWSNLADWDRVRHLPNANYPNATPDTIRLFNSPYGTVNQLESVRVVQDSLLLWKADLINVKGLKNLQYVGKRLFLFENNLTTLDGLENLRHVGYLNLAHNTRLKDISALKNITYAEKIEIDHPGDARIQARNIQPDLKPTAQLEAKIPADAWLCLPEQENVFIKASQDELCESV